MPTSHDPNDPDFPHGSTFGYRLGCRCQLCKKAKHLDWQDYKARQINPFEDFEGQVEPDQIAELVKDLVLKIRCDCGEWHESNDPGFQCPSGALPPDFSDDPRGGSR